MRLIFDSPITFFPNKSKTRSYLQFTYLSFQEAKLVHNLRWVSGSQMHGLAGCKTLRSGRSLASSRGYQIMACPDSCGHGWKVSTAASDAERERVLHPACPCTWLPLTLTAHPRVSPPKEVFKNVHKRLL